MSHIPRLSRSDIRQRTDKPTNSLILEYVGTRLRFDEYLYGLPEGTFFHVELDDVEFPEHLEALAEEACTGLDVLPEAELLRRAIAEALCAGVMVEAPDYLALLAEPETEWSTHERLELERRHRIAEARVRELARAVEGSLRVRLAQLRCLGIAPQAVEVPVVVPPPPPLMASWTPRPAETPLAVVEPVGPALDVVETEATEGDSEEVDDEERLDPRSRTVRRACIAVDVARELELPQRLPPGTRRRLRKMPSGAYLAYGEAMDVRGDLCAAMTDARAMARKDKHAVVIQWDGEWPVVVRRYGQGGRTVYKVESALRRYTREHALRSAWSRFEESVEKALAEVA